MKKLLIATTNPGKLGEIRRILSGLDLDLVSLADLEMVGDAPETGKTFEENSLMKAKYYCRKSGLPTMADDGGLEIDALGGQPGVNSHRWIDPDRESEDEELIEYTLVKMKKVPEGKRGAQLRTVVSFVTPDGLSYHADSCVRGVIPQKPSPHRTKGFPYRSLLYLPEIGKFYDHQFLTEAESEKYNHRGKAISKLIPEIKNALEV